MTGFALFFASTTCATLLASHLSAASFIAWKDLSGAWATHNLKRTTNGLRTYTQHLPSLLFDVLVLLLPCMYVFGLHREGQLTAPLFDFGATWTENAVLLGTALLKAVACNVLNRTWAMLIHWLFHVFPPLYKLIHKRHHCALKDMCATSGWQDTCLEFLGMEVLGVFLLAPTLLPVLCAPWQMHVLLAAYNGAAGAIDHSGFYVPGTIIDGRYHMVHHRDLYYNYAEMETLDWLFGTLRHHEVQDAALPPAREGQKVHTAAASIPAEPSLLVLQDAAGACQAIHELRRSSVGHATPGPTLWRTVRSATRGS